MITFAGAFEQVLGTLGRFEIPFFIGGSVASGVYGLPRQTNDINIVAAIPADLVREFCAVLASAFCVDPMRPGQRSLNGYKFDIFPASLAFPRSGASLPPQAFLN